MIERTGGSITVRCPTCDKGITRDHLVHEVGGQLVHAACVDHGSIPTCPKCSEKLGISSGKTVQSAVCPQCADKPTESERERGGFFPTKERGKESIGTYVLETPPAMDSLSQDQPRYSPSKPDQEWYAIEYMVGIVGGVLGFLIAVEALGDDLIIVALIAAWIAGKVSGHLIHPLAFRCRQLVYDYSRCPHGVIGGFTRGRCASCKTVIAEQQRKQAERHAQLESKRKIKDAAVALRKSEYKRLREQTVRQLDGLLSLSPYEFEDAVSDLFRGMGYAVEQTPYSNDRGRDAILEKDGQLYLLECKRHAKGRTIGRRDLQVFFAAVVEARARKGYFVTTGRLTSAAADFVRDKPIEIIAGYRLIELIRQVYPKQGRPDSYRVMCEECGDVVLRSLSTSEPAIECRNGHLVPPTLREKDIHSGTSSAKSWKCPICGSSMRVRRGRRGRFLGCMQYPSCRGTRNLTRGG